MYIWGAGGKLPAAGEFEGAQSPLKKKQELLKIFAYGNLIFIERKR